MRTRALLAGLCLTFLVSGWGSLLAAINCPRMQQLQGHSCCPPKVEHNSCDSDLLSHDMNVADEKSAALEHTGASANGTFSRPTESCAHCLSHQRSPSPTAAARVSNQPRRSLDLVIIRPLAADFTLLLPTLSSKTNLSRRSPPLLASHVPKHLLLSVFLI